MTTSLLLLTAVAAALLPVWDGPAGGAEPRGFEIAVSDAGFNPPVVEGVNVGDVLVFELYKTSTNHRVTFEEQSVCPGSRGAVPCWPELRFDEDQPSQRCTDGRLIIPGWRCMIVREPGKTVRFHDVNVANTGEIRVLGEATTTTQPGTPPSTAPTTTSSTIAPTTTTTARATSTTEPAAIHPFVIPDPPATTSTTAVIVPVAVKPAAAPPAGDRDKGKDKGKGKAAGAETPTPAAPAPPGSMPPDSVFDESALTPGPVVLPNTPLLRSSEDEANLESAAVVNLLDGKEEDPLPGKALVLPALLVIGLLAAVGGAVWWGHRATRYDPA
jgi:hypothetical protein